MEITIEEIKSIVLEIAQDISDIEYSDNLIDTGLLDSFMVMELLDIIEEKYQMEFPAETIVPENFESILSLYNTIKEII